MPLAHTSYSLTELIARERSVSIKRVSHMLKHAARTGCLKIEREVTMINGRPTVAVRYVGDAAAFEDIIRRA